VAAWQFGIFFEKQLKKELPSALVSNTLDQLQVALDLSRLTRLHDKVE
jgi:hypothetical protein